MLETVLRWVHVLSGVGVFGGVVALRWGLSAEARHDVQHVGKAYRVMSGLLLGALLAGLTLFILQIKAGSDAGSLPAVTHPIVGTKFLLLFGVGACVGIGSVWTRKGNGSKADGLLAVAALLLAISAALGIYVGQVG